MLQPSSLYVFTSPTSFCLLCYLCDMRVGGTPEYMAPEFILCIGNDHGVDLWSLGILLYEMVMLITPFALPDDNNVQELFKRITRIKVICQSGPFVFSR